MTVRRKRSYGLTVLLILIGVALAGWKPAIAPASTSMAYPDLSNVAITLDDLPPGFEEFSLEEVGLTEVLLPLAGIDAETFFVFADIGQSQVVMGGAALLHTGGQQAHFDAMADLDVVKGELREEFLGAIKGIGLGADLEVRGLVDVDDIGDTRVGFTVVGEAQGMRQRADAVVFRREDAAVFLSCGYLDGEEAAVSVGELARKMDARLGRQEGGGPDGRRGAAGHGEEGGGSPFGVDARVAMHHSGGFGLITALSWLKSARVKWVRELIDWRRIQPRPGEFRWANDDPNWFFDYDAAFEEEAEAGVEILGLLVNSPEWNPEGPVDSWLYQWCEFVEAVVDRYGSSGSGSVRYWEVGNEENSLAFGHQNIFPKGLSDYVKLLKASYETIKAADPQAQVVLGGLAGMTENDLTDPRVDYFAYLRRLKEYGAWEYFDIVAVHPYWWDESRAGDVAPFRPEGSQQRGPRDVTFQGELAQIAALVDELGSKPIWITEIGWAVGSPPERVTEEQQANYLVRMYVLSYAVPEVEKLFWFNLDNPEPGERPFALIRSAGTPRLAYTAYGTMANLLEGAQFEGIARHDVEGTYDYRFNRGDEKIAVVWNAQETQEYTMAGVGSPQATIVELDGTSQSVAVSDGQLALSVGESPVFVTWLSGARLGGTQTRPADGMEMVYMPVGEFQMGSTDKQTDYAVQLCDEYGGDCKREWPEDEQPVHTVALDGFWLDQTEVTNEQYRRCVEAGVCDPSEFEDESSFNGDNQPVVGVDWNDAQTYCQWAGARLPTEAEWEYAARGPGGRVYPWGNEWDAMKLNADGTADGYAYTAPVGSYPDGASWCGALDMAGNVWEWVADWYDYDYYSRSPQRNPTGPSSGELKVLRGGSWPYTSLYSRGADRVRSNRDAWLNFVGFRCARNS